MLLRLKFDSKAVKKPVISTVSLETLAQINIIRASVGPRRGEIIVDVSDEVAEKVEEAFKKHGVEVCRLKGNVERNDRCVHCGLCVSICPVEAIEIEKSGEVKFIEDKCILCGNCVKVCPVKALKLPV